MNTKYIWDTRAFIVVFGNQEQVPKQNVSVNLKTKDDDWELIFIGNTKKSIAADQTTPTFQASRLTINENYLTHCEKFI